MPVYGDNCDIAIVHGNKLYGLRPLPNPKIVTRLEFSNLREPFPFDQSKLINLKELLVSSEYEIDEDKTFKLQGFSNLEKLQIDVDIVDTFESLSKLTCLKAWTANFHRTEAILNSWTALKNLRELDMDYVSILGNIKMEFFLEFIRKTQAESGACAST